jgi:hypothetical protein
VQRGQVPIPFSVYREQYLSNLQAVVRDPLTDEEMQAIAGIDKNCRLIKGVVFLWEHAKGWEDLWDADGVDCLVGKIPENIPWTKLTPVPQFHRALLPVRCPCLPRQAQTGQRPSILRLAIDLQRQGTRGCPSRATSLCPDSLFKSASIQGFERFSRLPEDAANLLKA